MVDLAVATSIASKHVRLDHSDDIHLSNRNHHHLATTSLSNSYLREIQLLCAENIVQVDG